MLNLNREERALTQGLTPGHQVLARSAQDRAVLARSVQVEEQVVENNGPAPALAGQPDLAGVNPYALAQRVFELLRRDLRLERERRSPGR